jgi:hypothetical protein
VLRQGERLRAYSTDSAKTNQTDAKCTHGK